MEDGVQRSLGQIEGKLAALQDSVNSMREDSGKSFGEIKDCLDAQNGRIREGEQWRARITGMWLGISAMVGLGGGAVAAAAFKLIGG